MSNSYGRVSAPRRGNTAAAAGNRHPGAYRYNYMYESAARELSYEEEGRRNTQPRRKSRSVRSVEQPVSVSHVPALLLTGMVAFLTVSVIYYVQLMAAVATTNSNISSMQSRLKTLKTANDQHYEEINSSISLEEIKEIAINELGMKYAGAEQIVKYSSNPNDYVHQVAEVGR
ncbi:hypothetical protein [Lachnoclostridium sp. Marseille-P6806]|uniref:hypothetical protein n=1 Tax=Lachnoclostridium sp. Marseille-P6806 TaxID=2364793 RepID=UPI0010305EF4|nr:hypothetical protein [Lachnoclostridium sp. Marseille-P6806]